MIMNNLVFFFMSYALVGGFLFRVLMVCTFFCSFFFFSSLKLYTPAGSARRFFYDIIRIRKLEIDGLTSRWCYHCSSLSISPYCESL